MVQNLFTPEKQTSYFWCTMYVYTHYHTNSSIHMYYMYSSLYINIVLNNATQLGACLYITVLNCHLCNYLRYVCEAILHFTSSEDFLWNLPTFQLDTTLPT